MNERLLVHVKKGKWPVKNISKLLLLSLLATACGGGGGGDTSLNTASTSDTAPNNTTFTATGQALMGSEDGALTLYSPTDIMIRNIAKTISTSIFPAAQANSTDYSSSQSIYDVLCYSSYALDEFPPDVDLDQDGFPDINLTGNSGSIFKNLSIDSYGLDIADIANWDVRPDLFLLDKFIALEKNRAGDNNVILNIPSVENITLLNIDYNEDGVADSNIIPILSGQPNGVSLLNFDGNYDGTPDLNIDRDNDGIADTKIDENGDCIADYSITDVNGAVGASFAAVELLNEDTFGVVHSVTADADGKFQIENIKTGSYYLKIVADNGAKNVGTIVSIYINSEGSIGEHRLHSSPVVIGVSTPESSGDTLWGSSEVRINSSIDFSMIDSLDYTIRFYDFNNKIPAMKYGVQSNEGTWSHENYYAELTPDPAIFEYHVSYSLSDINNLCVSSQTESSYSLQTPGTDTTFSLCRRDDTDPLSDTSAPSSVSEIKTFSDMYCVANLDGHSGFMFTGGNDDEECDVFFSFRLENIGWIPRTGTETPDFKLANITLNGEQFDRCCDVSWAINGYWSPEILPSTLSISIELDTEIPLENSLKWVGIETPNDCFFGGYDQKIKGSEDFPTYDMSCLEDFPMYEYKIPFAACEIETNNSCGSNSEGGIVTYIPPRAEKPSILNHLLADEEQLYDRIISPGETVAFRPEVTDPNGLNWEWTICFHTEPYECSSWLPQSASYSRTFTDVDANSQFRIDVSLRNNDGVAYTWDSSSDIDTFTERDSWQRFWPNVSEY
jgi:hypothetical protein